MGFLPNRKRKLAANKALSVSGEGKTITHREMTGNAILQAVATVLIDNPNGRKSSENVQQLLRSETNFDMSKLINAYYEAESDASRKRRKTRFSDTVDVIHEYNTRVDSRNLRKAHAHFDSEQFRTGQDRLVSFRKGVALEITKKNFHTARKYTGRMLHTLQDFYSHTNWVENYMYEENGVRPYDVLGEPDMKIENIVSATETTMEIF